MYGKITVGVKRTTFIIDEKGYIEKIFTNVNPDQNAQEIINYLKGKNQSI